MYIYQWGKSPCYFDTELKTRHIDTRTDLRVSYLQQANVSGAKTVRVLIEDQMLYTRAYVNMTRVYFPAYESTTFDTAL